MSATVKSSARSVFRILAGNSSSLPSHKPADVKKLLHNAQPAVYARTLTRFERCTERFAQACQRYETGEKGAIAPRFREAGYLNHMAQAMPYKVPMPTSFHNARWPFQFARNEEALSNPFGDAVLGAMAQLRSQQASLLRQVRQSRRKPVYSPALEQSMHLWRRQQIEANYKLLKPLEPVRHTLRLQALAKVKAAPALPKAKVIHMRPAVRPALMVVGM